MFETYIYREEMFSISFSQNLPGKSSPRAKTTIVESTLAAKLYVNFAKC